MFYSKTTRIVSKTRRKNIGSFLAMLFCTLVIVSSIGSSFGIRNSFAQTQQQQLQLQQAPTIAYQSPWSNNLQISSAGSNSQPLCKAGICSQSLNPASTTTQSQSSARSSTTATGTTPTNSADPTSFKASNTQTFTNNKVLNLNHRFVSNKVVGPDRSAKVDPSSLFLFCNY